MKVTRIFGLWAFSALLFFSCTDEEQAEGGIVPNVTTAPVGLSLNMTPMQGGEGLTRVRGEGSLDLVLGETSATLANGVATRASSGALTDAQENTIDNICVFQFKADGKLIYREYAQLMDGATKADISLAMGQGACTVYVLANVGNRANEVALETTLADFKKKADEVTTGKGSGLNVPMCGSGSFDSETATSLSVTLTRSVARVSLVLTTPNSGDVFTPVSIKLMNVAKKLYYVESNATAPVAAELTTYTSDNSKEITWYIPENRAGKTTGITDWKDRYEGNVPATATYIQIEGTYKPNGGTVKDVAYTIYLGAADDTNDFNVARNTKYTVNAAIKGTNLNDGRVLVGKDLSAGGKEIANCYLANAVNTWYRFKATIRGNGAATPAQISYTGAAITENEEIDPDAAALVWETRDGSNRTIEYVGYSRNGYIVFKTGSASEGNAVLAVKKGTKTLWSWHIWKTAAFTRDNITVQKYVTKPRTVSGFATVTENTYYMMDRNLGAASAEASRDANKVPKTYGLYYQFGRKDPFPAARNMERRTDNNSEIVDVYDEKGNQILKNQNQERCSTIANNNTQADFVKQVAYAIENPLVFIMRDDADKAIGGVTNPSYNWIYAAHAGTEAWAASNKLWGGELNDEYNSLPLATEYTGKTIYDPCPYGYHMPPQDAWTNITSGAAYNTGTETEYNGPDQYNVADGNETGGFMNPTATVFGRRFYTYGTTETADNVAFYPAAGGRDGYGGQVYNVGWGCYAWSASPYSSSSQYGGFLNTNGTWVGPVNHASRSDAFPVRCVRDSSGTK